jgi:predicted nucleic acid-binding protein
MPTALLDTSVLVDLGDPAVLSALPDDIAITTISLAELTAGPQLTTDPLERARRTAHLQQVEALFDAVDFSREAARSFGLVVAAVSDAGRSHRSRFADLLIAAVAHAGRFNLYTRNESDFVGLDSLLTIVAI